ncbi:hypothetical protein HPP92_028403 [Vanilla planifolia]|uniref:Uncharacterized protein n=1 Tax=Vanilla planifolia TaxID=51239 RepID=A0A835P5Q7_VANPL|nr:hypothetical protein HPP92_028403 [Vanilla planifolia]KAG0447394.1 hypothetical protein HPP92_028373 [Vanilla planifolia]
METINAGSVERAKPLCVLDDGDKEYEQGGSKQEVTWKRQEQNIDGNDELIGEGKKVSSPQLIVLHGIGGDGVWATKVK